MIRTSARRHGSPVYREVLRDAFKTAWTERRYWPIAFLAAILFSAGSYDLIYRAIDGISTQSTAMMQGSAAIHPILIWRTLTSDIHLVAGAFSAIEVLIGLSLLIVAAAAFSCTAQGALVYAISSTKRGKHPSLTEAFHVGGGAFWPIVALNTLALSAIWLLRFLVAFPLFLSLNDMSATNFFLYLASFVVFVPLSFLVRIIQVFSLNAMILQGAPITDAIIRAYIIFKRHWLVVVETAVILLLLTIIGAALFAGILFVGVLAILSGVALSALLQSKALLFGLLCAGFGLTVLAAFAAAAFMTQLQYATWTHLYRRIGEGGVVPKLHRWLRTLFGITSVPQS